MARRQPVHTAPRGHRPPTCTLSGAGAHPGAGRSAGLPGAEMSPSAALPSPSATCDGRRSVHSGLAGPLGRLRSTYPAWAPGDPQQTLPSQRPPPLRRGPPQFSKMAETLPAVRAARPYGWRNFRPCALRRLRVLRPFWKRANFFARSGTLKQGFTGDAWKSVRPRVLRMALVTPQAS